jgi:hypothetical protein
LASIVGMWTYDHVIGVVRDMLERGITATSTYSALAVPGVVRRHLEEVPRERGIQEMNAEAVNSPTDASGGKTLVQELDAAQPGEAINNPDSCLEGPGFDSDRCRELDRRYRVIYCSDIPPGPRYNCSQQAALFDKCTSSWLVRESFCLDSCDRCGAKCVDEVPPGYDECSPDLCETDVYIGGAGNGTASAGGPWCLKTCRRCSPSPPRGVVVLLP